jgi:hypothetical protein
LKDEENYAKNGVNKRDSAASYRKNNPEKIKSIRDNYYSNNSDEIKRKSNSYYRENSAAISEKRKKGYDKEFYKNRWESHKEKSLKDPSLRAISNVRLRVCNFLKRKNKYSKKLGCSQDTLRTWIESQFLPGMTWENYGQWHIDHKYPLSIAYLEGQDSFAKACHYTNLQPLWAIDNIRKSDRV